MPCANTNFHTFQKVRQKLDDLGFYQPLVTESLPLVEVLLNELYRTKDKLKQCQSMRNNDQNFTKNIENKKADLQQKSVPVNISESLKKQNVEKLERKILDLELLNHQAVTIIQRLQTDSMEKSKKILKLEAGINRAKVITKSPDWLKPKIEMSSLVKPQAKKPSHWNTPKASLDIIKMYEQRNKRLDQELGRLQKKLDQSQTRSQNEKEFLLDNNDKSSNDNSNSSNKSPRAQSAYMFKLIQENQFLKEQLDRVGEVYGCDPSRIVLRSNKSNHQRFSLTTARSCEDIRTAVEQSHLMMHNKCLKNQVSHLQGAAHSQGYLEVQKKEKHIEAQQEHIQDILKQLDNLKEDNKILNKRVDELNEIRNRQRAKLDEMQNRQNILLRTGTSDYNEYKKVEELIGYIERQRDVYKNSVGRLLRKLDPEGKMSEESIIEELDKRSTDKISRDKMSTANIARDKRSTDKMPTTGNNGEENRFSSDKVDFTSVCSDLERLRNIQQNCKKVLQGKGMGYSTDNETVMTAEKSYRPSPYRNSTNQSEQDLESTYYAKRDEYFNSHHQTNGTLKSSTIKNDNVVVQNGKQNERNKIEDMAYAEKLKSELSRINREKFELEGQLVSERQDLKHLNEKMENELALLKLQLRENERKLNEKARSEIDETDSSLAQLHERIRAQQEAISGLESQISTKQRHLQKLSDDKDILHNQLDDKTIELGEARCRIDELSGEVSRLKADKTIVEQKLKQCLEEIERNRFRIDEVEISNKTLRERQGADKDVALEVRRENSRLQEELARNKEEKLKYESEIADLRGHVQGYVNEVKRIEELFAAREKERTELLLQYQQLSDEVDTAESYGRRMESQVESLNVQLLARESELEASQRRLADLERDLVELSLSNENYRGQVANLSTKIDVANSQLTQAKSQSVWINTDLTNIHELAIKLNDQKLELQNQISEQNNEIENLTTEIKQLRKEVTELSDKVRQEREKSQNLQDILSDKENEERGK